PGETATVHGYLKSDCPRRYGYRYRHSVSGNNLRLGVDGIGLFSLTDTLGNMLTNGPYCD
ncbi:MAG: hypothetical protein ACJ8LM_07550, partial [Candidatus Udaeobacter sp.]